MSRNRARRRSRWAATARCAAVALCLASTACSGATNNLGAEDAATAAVQQRLGGMWRLTSYVPEQSLSPALMLAMKLDVIVVRFEDGRLRSQSIALNFDRGYRIASPGEHTFKLYITDDVGVEYENLCEFDRSGRRMSFKTVTAPWRGQGILER